MHEWSREERMICGRWFMSLLNYMPDYHGVVLLYVFYGDFFFVSFKYKDYWEMENYKNKIYNFY